MPFRVTFKIFEPGKGAPCYTTSDRRLAYIELNARRAQPGQALTYMTADVSLDPPSSRADDFLMLLYSVRMAMRKYYNGGRRHEDMLASLALESQLDKWIKRTRDFLTSHPGFTPADTKSHAFFLIVEEWRGAFLDRKRYASRKNYDNNVYREMTRKIREYEEKIDDYIRNTIGL